MAYFNYLMIKLVMIFCNTTLGEVSPSPNSRGQAQGGFNISIMLVLNNVGPICTDIFEEDRGCYNPTDPILYCPGVFTSSTVP